LGRFEEGYEYVVGFIRRLAEGKVRAVRLFKPGK
jgi:hypothetical protein